MRQVGTIEESEQAERFGAYLQTQGISCRVDSGSSGFVVWVHDEDRVAQAKVELARFRTDPDNERYRAAPRQAEQAARARRKPAATRQKNIDLRDRWSRPSIEHGPATFGLMALTIIVGVLTGLDPGKHPEFFQRLAFSTDGTMQQIQQGEVWRLVSPIFIHMGIMHFLFNMIYLRDFGLLIEYRVGTPKFLVMAMVIAIVSNTAQFSVAGPAFGGLSGVIYGLFGYIWVRGRLDPESGLWMPPQTVTVMLAWFVMCYIGLIPRVANTAHGAGLIVGVMMGASRPFLNSILRR